MSVRPSWPGSDTPPRQSIVETGTKLGEMHDRSSLEHGHRAFKSLFCRFAIRNRPENAKSEAPSGRAIVHFAEFWPNFPKRLQERAARDDPRRANAPQSQSSLAVRVPGRRIEPRLPKRTKAKRMQKSQTPTGAKRETADTPPMFASAASTCRGSACKKSRFCTHLHRQRKAEAQGVVKTEMRGGTRPCARANPLSTRVPQSDKSAAQQHKTTCIERGSPAQSKHGKRSGARCTRLLAKSHPSRPAPPSARRRAHVPLG